MAPAVVPDNSCEIWEQSPDLVCEIWGQSPDLACEGGGQSKWLSPLDFTVLDKLYPSGPGTSLRLVAGCIQVDPAPKLGDARCRQDALLRYHERPPSKETKETVCFPNSSPVKAPPQPA